jgi:hypothetical protein
MSDPREQLTHHLTPHGVTLEIVGGRSTADLSEVLASMDYAMVLGMVEPRQAAMLLAKYCDDSLEERKCRSWWLMECIEYGAAKGWKRPKARMVQGMAYATISEHMGHGTRCMLCQGTASRMVGNLPVECPGCSGRGFLEYLPEQYCDEIGCTMLEWDKIWRERVGWARRALYRWEMDAAEALKARLWDD